MAKSKYVPFANAIPDKRKKEEKKNTGYRYDKTGKKINSSNKDNGSKKTDSSNKKGEATKASPSYKYDSKGRKIESSSANNKQSNPYQIGNNGPVAVTYNKPNTPDLYGLQTRTASPDAQSRMLEYAYRQAYGYNNNTIDNLGLPNENAYKNALAFQINQAAHSSDPNTQAFAKYYSDWLNAAELNDSVLAYKDKEIESLKAKGQNDNWWNKLWGTHRYSNQDEIDAAEKEREEIVDLLRTSSMDDITGKISAGTNLANYSRDDYLNDLMYLVNVYTLGHESDPQELQTTTQRIRDFVGGAADDVETVAKNDTTGGNWVSDYLNVYDQRVNTLDRYIAKNSSAYGKDYGFDADEYIGYLRSINQLEQNAADAEQRQAERDQQIEEKYGGLKNADDFDAYSQHVPTEGGYYDEYDVLDWKAQVKDMVALSADKEKFEDAPYWIGLDPQVDTEAYEYLEYGLQHMTDENRKIFNYLYNHPDHGPDEALQYLEDISYDTMRQNTAEYTQSWETALENGDWRTYVAASAAAPVFGFLNSLAGIDTAFGKLTGETYHEFHPNFKYGTFRDTITGGVGNKIAEATPGMFKIAGQNAWQMGYNAVMSSAESMMSVGAFGKAGSISMGFGAFNSTYQQGLADGKSDTDAFIDALVEGGIEVGTEAIGIDALMGDKNNPLGYFLKNVIAEGGEEAIGSAARMSYDQLKYGIESQINTRIAELRAQGKDPTEAAKIAWGEWLREFGQDTITGSISGGFMSGPSAAVSQIQNVNKGIEIQQAIDEAVETGDLEGLKTFIEVSKGLPDQPRYIQRIIERVESQIAEEEAAQKAGEETSQQPEVPAEPKLPKVSLPREDVSDTGTGGAKQEIKLTPEQIAERSKVKKPGETKKLPVYESSEEKSDTGTGGAKQEIKLTPEQIAERSKVKKPGESKELPVYESSEEKSDTGTGGKEIQEQADDLAEEMQENPENADKVAEKITKQKKGKVTKGQLGQLYRYVMTQLQEDAQNTLRESMSYNVAKELKRGGIKGEEAKSLATSILRMQDGSFTAEDVEAIQGNSTARNVLMNWVKKDAAAQEASAKVNTFANALTPRTTTESAQTNARDAIEANDDFAVKAAEVEEKAKGMQMSEGEDSTMDGEAVKIVGAAPAGTADGGNVAMIRVVTPDGEERIVDADSIAYSEADSAAYDLAQYATSYGANADIMYGAYQAGQDVTAYARGFNAAVQHGSDGRNIASLMNSKNVSGLTENQIKTAYEVGRSMRVQRGQQAQAERSKKGAGVKTGRVDTSAIKNNVLTKHQRATIRAMEGLAEVLDMNVRFVESKANAKGRYTTENGSWDANTRMLTVDIHAGSNLRNDVRYSMMDTVGHELTHYIRQFADNDLWNEYQDFIMSHLESKMDLDREIKRKLAANEDLTRDDAIEEIIADASSQALSRITEAQINELAQSNPTLFKKIASFIKKWVSGIRRKIRNAFETEAAEANRFAKAMEDSLDEMAAKWNAMLVNANRNAQGMQSAAEAIHMSAATQQAIENDQTVDAEAELKHSIREDERFGEDARRVNQTNRFVSKAALEQALKDRKTIRDIFLDPDNRDLLKLPPDIMGDTFVSDASYGGTEENTTVCIRSMAAQALMDLISQNLGRPLTVQDTLLISQEIAGLTDRPECYYCYVATDRRAYRDFLGQYLEQRNAVIEKYKAGADKAALYTEFLGGRKPTANMKTRFNMWLNAVDNGTALIDGNDLASLENLFAEVDSLRNEIIAEAANVSGVDAGKLNIVNGVVKYTKAGKQITATTLNALMKSNPGMAESINRYMQLTDATAYAQSASWAKKMKGYAAYNGHILNWSQKRVNDLNKHYGLRMYSFSDFSPAFILENMQMVTDAAVRGLNMLGYTKEMDFAEIFAPSGMNINISTFAYEQGGKVMEDYKQGASWERAKALRDKHPNVGIVMVATSDNILEWALQQDWVDVVIPYHLVRTGTDVAEYFGYKNYTGVSADGKGMTFAEKNKGKSKKERVTSVSPVEHRNDLISYVDALERYGLTPRFAQWLNGLDDYRAGKISPMQFRAMNPNYMKLVNETRRSYADTDPVQPKFNMEAAQESIQQMIREGGYYTPVGGTMEAQFEIAGTVADKIRGTEADVKLSAREMDAAEDADIRYQMRDPYAASDREMLVNALENANLSVEDRNRLNGYKKKMSELDEKQKLLEQTTDRINMLEATDEDGNRDEIIRLKNAAQIYAQQIERADEVLLKIEAMAPIKRLADRQRSAYIESVKSGYDERLQKYKQKQKEKIDERIAKIKEREAGKRKDMRKEMNRLKKVAEPNLKERYRNKILSDVKKLYSWVATPTNKAHVPEFLKAPLGEFIQSIDFSSADYLKNAKAGIKDVSMAEALEKLRRVLANVHNQKNIEEGAQEQFGYMDLPAQYLEQLDYFVGEVKKALQNAGTVTDTPLMLLNSDQLAYLSEAIAILKHSVEKMNENFNKSQFESPRSTANATIEDMYKLKAKVKTNKTLETINSMYNWKNTTPYYAFQRMGAGGKAIFEALQDGWDKMAENSSILIEYAQGAFTSKQAKAWTKDIKTIQLANGDEIKMTVSQIMSMYCLNKREQAVGHMLGGGIRIEDINLRAGNTLHDVDNHTLTESDINKILNLLTPEQMSVANKLQEFMNTTCTDWGNEISMKRFGYKMFTEKFYFPIEVDANNLGRSEDKQENKKSMFRLLNMSAMKPLTPKANNALVVRDIFDVFTEHTTDIAKYNALALPILDTIRWFNYTDKSEVMDKEGNRTGQIKARSTQKALEHAYGKNAKDYIRKFMEDLNAEHDGGRNDGVLQRLMGNAKAASVGWNDRVYLLQITSLPRAAYAINPKYLLKGLAKIRSLNPVNAIKGTEAQDKIGIMKWKSLGFYNTDIARSTRSMVRRDEGFLSKLRGWGMKPAEWGDNWTSNIIYEAAKAEMKDKHPNLQPGSNAYDAMLNKRVREIVYKTQVVDSTMTRSDFMRSKGMMQMFTAFMSEPTLTVNMLNESIQEIVAKHRTGVSVKESIRSVGGKTMKAAAVFVFTATFSAIVEALFDAIRDDDEYETLMEKFMQGLFGEKVSDADGAWGKFKAVFDGNIGDNVNIFAMLPLIKEGVSLLEGYEENSMVTQVAKQFIDVKDSIEAWQEGKRPLYDVIYKGFKTIGSATGVGVQNVSRDGVGLYNTFLADAIGQPKVQTYENTKSDAAAAYYDAITKGDTDKAAWVIERAAINGLDTAEFAEKMTGLVKADYAAGKIDADTATKYLESYAGKNRNDAHWLLKEWDYAGEGNFSKYGDLRTALIDGNKSNAQAAYNELAKHGTNEVDIRKDIAKLYNDGTATNMLSLQLRSNNLYTSDVKLKADGEKHPDDFDAFITAIVNGSGIEREADKLFEKGYTVKQCMTAINGAFGNENDIYRKMEMYNSREAEILMDRILDGYEAIGLDRQDEIEWIEDNWKM